MHLINLKFRLIIYDNIKLPEISNGLIYYFENNDFVKKYYTRYLSSNINIINDIENEIRLLSKMRIEGAKNNLDLSSVNIISGKDDKTIK